jgi:hypothetical protein
VALKVGIWVTGVVCGFLIGTGVVVSRAQDPEPIDDVAEAAVVQPEPDSVDRVIDCLAWYESRGDPTAVNRSSGAAGPLQFLLSTWLSTPQGQAGLSRYDPAAARAAARWMIDQGRLHEWSTWRLCA